MSRLSRVASDSKGRWRRARGPRIQLHENRAIPLARGKPVKNDTTRALQAKRISAFPEWLSSNYDMQLDDLVEDFDQSPHVLREALFG